MNFIFNLQVDQSAIEAPIIKDINAYTVSDYSVASGSTTNTIDTGTNPKLLTLTNYTPTPGQFLCRAVRLNGGAYSNVDIDVERIVQNGADLEIYFFDDVSDDATNISVTFLFLNANDDDVAVTRERYALLLYLTHKQSAGDVGITFTTEQSNSTAKTASEWAFTTDDGGWFTLNMYAVERWRNQDESGAVNYMINEIVFTLDGSGNMLFYKSLSDNNNALLGDVSNWEAYGADTLPEEADLIVSEDVPTITTQVYQANIFLDRKLLGFKDEIWLKTNCECQDPCKMSDALKLEQYWNQIQTLVRLKNYTKAQSTYEKAIEFAQDELNTD